MALQRWIGNSPSVAQVVKLTPASPISGDTFNVTINGKMVSYATAAGTVSDVCAGLQSALSNSANPEYLEIGFTNLSSYISATSNKAGRPFTLSVSVTPSVVAIPVLGVPTASTGGSLTSGTTYYYTMTATNAAGQTTQATQVSYAASGTNLTAVLTWTAVPGATGYKIYRSTTSGSFGSSTLLTTIGSGSTVTYSDTGISTSSGTPPGTNTATSPATFTQSTTVASAGPNDWSIAANWSTGTVPATGDSVLITNTSASILYGLSQSAITLASLQIDNTFTGTIGNPDFNSSSYFEYRPTYLAIGATSVIIGQNGGAGSGRMRLNFGTVQTTISVYNTGTALDTGLTALQIQGSNSSNALYGYKGSVGVAVQNTESASFASITAGFITNQNTDFNFYGGKNLTLTTFNQNGGIATLNNSLTTHNATFGTLYFLGTGTIETSTLDNAKLVVYSTGTISNLNVGPKGVADFAKDARPKTVTNTTMYIGSTLNDPIKCVTYTNGIALSQCRVDEVTIDLGENRTIGLLS